MSRRIWGAALAAYVVSQGLLTVGAFVKIPIITSELGARGYGFIIVLTAGWSVVNALADGLAQTSRVIVAEHGTARAYTYGLRLGTRLGFLESAAFCGLGGAAILAAAIYLSWDSLLPWACVVVGGATVLPLAACRGALEAQNRVVMTNFALSANTFVGVPVLILLLEVWPSVISAALATVLGLAAPYVVYFVAASLRIRVAWQRLGGAGIHLLEGLRSSLSMTGWSLANLMVYAFDPIIIASTVGLVASGEYGLASRIMTLAVAVPIGLNGLLSARVSSWRGRGDAEFMKRRLVNATVAFTLVGVVLSGISAALGPTIASLLSGGAVPASVELYWWLAGFALLVTASSPFMMALSGPRAVHMRAGFSLGGACVNVLLSVALAHLLGVEGPVVASVICTLLTLGCLLVAVGRDTSLLMGTHIERESEAVASR